MTNEFIWFCAYTIIGTRNRDNGKMAGTLESSLPISENVDS